MNYTFRYALDFPKCTDEDLVLLTIKFNESTGAIPSFVLTSKGIEEHDLKSRLDIIKLIDFISGVESDIFGMSLSVFDIYKKFFTRAFYFRKEE